MNLSLERADEGAWGLAIVYAKGEWAILLGCWILRWERGESKS
jgi:hypothetical protein